MLFEFSSEGLASMDPNVCSIQTTLLGHGAKCMYQVILALVLARHFEHFLLAFMLLISSFCQYENISMRNETFSILSLTLVSRLYRGPDHPLS